MSKQMTFDEVVELASLLGVKVVSGGKEDENEDRSTDPVEQTGTGGQDDQGTSNDGDDDSTPEGDTDHDYWTEDGKPTQKLTDLLKMCQDKGLMRMIEPEPDPSTPYDPETRKESPKFAMQNGSYPINNCSDVSDAAKLAHHSNTYSFDQVKKHVMKAKNALGCPDSVIPDSWSQMDRSTYDPYEVRKGGAKWAMPDGSFPIDNLDDVRGAAILAHHSPAYSFEAIKRHVERAMEGLDAPKDLIPDSWYEIQPENFNAEKHSVTASGNVERRNITVQDIRLQENGCRADGQPESYTIIGYAAVFNSMSENLGGFREKITPGAFRSAIDKKETVALWNHDENFPLANMTSGSLRLYEDKHGLRSEIDLDPNVSYARDLLYNVRSGRVSKMSFGFTTDSDEWDLEDGQTVRTLTGIRRLLDVSPVTNPAYRDTEVSARAILHAEELRNRQEPGADPSTSAGMELLMLQATLIQRGL